MADDSSCRCRAPMLRPSLPLTARLMALKKQAQRRRRARRPAALAGQLDRVDAWIADGLLGGEHPNAADLQIGSTIRLLVRDRATSALLMAARPAARADALLPADGR